VNGPVLEAYYSPRLPEKRFISSHYKLFPAEEVRMVIVPEPELEIWKRALPAMAERCRDWDHKPSCKYSSKVPLTMDIGRPPLCSCGVGRVSENFLKIDGWEAEATRSTRIAISPVFAAPYLVRARNGVIDKKEMAKRCPLCPKPSIAKCSGCNVAKYCSKECQKRDRE